MAAISIFDICTSDRPIDGYFSGKWREVTTFSTEHFKIPDVGLRIHPDRGDMEIRAPHL